jgi:hypothetical protein
MRLAALALGTAGWALIVWGVAWARVLDLPREPFILIFAGLAVYLFAVFVGYFVGER